MEKIKPPSVAGIFYPDKKDELENLIKSFNAKADFGARAVISPHAGLVYSGALALLAIKHLDKTLKNIFVIAPAHRVPFSGLALSGFDFWETPLGKIPLNREICSDLIKNFGAKVNDGAFTAEHSVEIQLPLLQTLFDNIKIIPVLTGGGADVYGLIAQYYPDRQNGFIISSDLSHFLNYHNAIKTDLESAQMIESLDISGFFPERACGAAGIKGLVRFAKNNNFSLIRIGMKNSGDVTKEHARVVGYGAWALFEGTKNELIKKYYSDFVLEFCRNSVKSAAKANHGEMNQSAGGIPSVFFQSGASFVTLEKAGRLRGCIGSILAHRPLISDLFFNAGAAAIHDPRFSPLREEEIEGLEIAVSLLSDPSPIQFESEAELLDKIRPKIDGIIIKEGQKRGVYLPSVWEQLPDKKDFLNSLKVKAGLPCGYFSKTLEAYRFETVYIKQT